MKPLADVFGLEKIFVVTMQAISGAGYPGVPSLDILGNVVPFISGEEEKMEDGAAEIAGAVGWIALYRSGPWASARTATAWRWLTGTWSAFRCG